jgi:uncharacterized damage-inducible protein DinB
LEDRVRGLGADVLTRRLDDTWSIQENVGHLLDMEPLWHQRVEDLLTQRQQLTAADLENRRTHEASHNAASLVTLLEGFRSARSRLVRRLDTADDESAAHTAQHPRLGVPMTLVDHAVFVAEHDDYHLARITELLHAWGVRGM